MIVFEDAPRTALAFALLLGACADDGGSGSEQDTEATSTAASTAGDDGNAPSTSDSPVSTTASSNDAGDDDGNDSTTTPGDSTAAGDTAADTTGNDETGDPGLDANGCPGDAPTSWVGCETFDAITDPATEIAEWNVMDAAAFNVVPDEGGGADQALQITLVPGVQFGGWVSLRYGIGPDGPNVDSPDERFDEIWTRYTLRLGDNWPGRPIGDVGEVIAFNGPDWGIAAELALRGDGEQRLHPLAWTCINGGTLACDGVGDWSGDLQFLWGETGSVMFADANAGQTFCLEAHVRLNAPGQSDGEAHVWVDGTEEVARTGVDWLGTWDEYGLNGLRFTNFETPPAQPLSFYVDDVVFATERVGCD